MNPKLHRREFLACSGAAALGCCVPKLFAQEFTVAGDLTEFVRISKRDPRYFELTNGKPYIPIGLNMINPPNGDDDDLTRLESDWLRPLSENGGNFIRIWMSLDYEIERERAGNFDQKRTERLAKLLALGKKYGIRMKLCTENFRHLGEWPQWWTARPIYKKENGGPAENIRDFFTSEAGRALYKKKLDWFAEHFGSDPIVFGWELWNEMDCVGMPLEDVLTWSTEMLGELRRRWPEHMAMQSFGSYDRDEKTERYRKLCELPGNDVLQVHRYLDLGAQQEICRGPVAALAADAVSILLALKIPKPVMLAEAGAVEPNHSGPFKLYAKDKAGIILHDVLFAPFFVGAAGPGHCWHWDSYVAPNNLWFQFGRFAAAVDGLDPPAENFQPFELDHERLFVFGLKGKTKTMVWSRDKQNTWKTELEEEKEPETLTDLILDLGTKGQRVRFYDPWENRWMDGKADDGKIVLPSFRRSLVVKIS